MVPRLESPRFFDAFLARTLAQARRYGRRAALLIVVARPEGEDAKMAIRRAALHLLGLLRDADVATLQGEELRVLLPETDRLGAQLLRERILRHLPEAASLRIGAAAYLEDGVDAEDLLDIARRRAAEDEGTGLAGKLRPLGFWECLRRLLADADLPRLPLSPAMVRTAAREAILELSRASTVRGIAVVCSGGADEGEILEALPVHRLSGRLFVAWPDGSGPPHPSVTYVPVEEERLSRFDFVFFLAGHSAYVVLRDAGENALGVHAADHDLACLLVSRFRDAYGLREKIG